MKVLLVDNDQVSGASLTQALTQENYVVNLVTDGETALRIACSYSYDLIVLNLISQHQLGVKICEILREKGYQGSIMMRSRRQPSEANLECDRSLNAGANDCLGPSDDIQTMVSRIQALINPE